MNIFYLDKDPVIAAQSMCDKHVLKMVIESNQLLSTAQRLYREQNPDGNYPFPTDILYKATHKNHPCAIWTRKAYYNYLWVAKHAVALSEEYTYRYGKIHKCDSLARILLEEPPLYKFGGPTELALCMPDEYKVVGDPIESYKNYYISKLKTMKMNWTKRDVPSWILEKMPAQTQAIGFSF